jgi:hypothetical protein
MHILSGLSSAIRFLECIIFLMRDVLILLQLSSLVMLSLGVIKYRRINLCWGEDISTHGKR